MTPPTESDYDRANELHRESHRGGKSVIKRAGFDLLPVFGAGILRIQKSESNEVVSM